MTSSFNGNGSIHAHTDQFALNKSLMEEYKAAFDFFDENKDGCITKEELHLAMNKCGQRPSKLDIALIMSQGDHDDNGVITFDEFTALMKGKCTRGKYTYSQLREQFELFDKDKDGFIEKLEMIEIVRELALGSSFPREVIEQLFKEADVDGDGKISFEEFILAVN
ncbi:hypothetical protein PENTCL1PPCAC_29640 [Pristionchus entomophagus]|uniref:EF-hand domain-containing protein n=1 Tax=Pristionchus entomophagus TaxID=358040 RepID=A0AAV5UK70_9BILA|nr:hypothetical protein PENTCL1PPCAC_29640 [Pristionchus entomophagus]